uniref:ACT domain-containing protein n=1 Tax=Peronospora matthiolae TaxID=2874970 RepID=A0AAV1UBF4_9STRA
MLEEEVTFANAKKLAGIMGIQTVEHKHDEASGRSFFDQLIFIFEKENETSKTITSIVFSKNQLRFVSFDGVPMDAIPSGSMLLFNNIDQPGVLHKVTSMIARHEISIGCFGLARLFFGTAAVSVLNVDEAIPDTVVEELGRLGMLTNAEDRCSRASRAAGLRSGEFLSASIAIVLALKFAPRADENMSLSMAPRIRSTLSIRIWEVSIFSSGQRGRRPRESFRRSPISFREPARLERQPQCAAE